MISVQLDKLPRKAYICDTNCSTSNRKDFVLAQITVLIVDDNQELLEVFRDGLPLAGPFTVLTAQDGAAGLQTYYDQRPDCVVIDIKMPNLDGYQLVRAFRGDPETVDTPLIVLTALPQEQAEFASLVAGSDQFLVKPIMPRELAGAIQRALLVSDEERVQRLQRLSDDAAN
jgi:DNA-binding response OmpR family regulator